MTTNAIIRREPLATKGDTKFFEDDTSQLLKTPAVVATNPFKSVARPMIVERSGCERASEDDDEISHDSNAENRIEVEMPPRTRPKRRIGSQLKRTHAQVIVYVMQNARHTFLRPLPRFQYHR
jgi:hypothetical protein